MSESSILTAQRGAVRTLTLNRPSALNSFNGEMHRQLRVQLEDAAANAKSEYDHQEFEETKKLIEEQRLNRKT